MKEDNKNKEVKLNSQASEKEGKKSKKKSKALGNILFTAFFLFFIGVMDYPFVAQLINERTEAKLIQNYEESFAASNKEDIENELKLADLYNKRLANNTGITIKDAFQSMDIGDAEYLSLLNTTEDGIMGVVSIPKIQIDLPIYHGTTEQALQNGTGHLQGTSLPVGGESTHACISGHRGLPNKKLFTSLDLIENGDIFYIKVYGETLAYEVYKIEEVTPDNVEPLKIVQGEDIVTLITCTPYGINTHRLFVSGKRIPYVESEDMAAGTSSVSFMEWVRTWWWVLATAVLLLVMVRMLIIYNRGSKKRRNGN